MTLEVADAHCDATTTQNLIVNSLPTLSVSSDLVEGCSPLKVLFDAQTEADVVWDFGDGSGGSGLSPTHEFVGDEVNGSTFDVLVTATNEAACSTQESMVVHTLPGARAEMSIPETLCAPVEQTFLEQSEGAIESLTFEDGTIEAEPTSLCQHPNPSCLRRYSWSLWRSGCRDTTSAVVYVHPAADFEPSTKRKPVRLSRCSHLPLRNPKSRLDVDDGSPASVIPNPVHVFRKHGLARHFTP